MNGIRRDILQELMMEAGLKSYHFGKVLKKGERRNRKKEGGMILKTY